MVIFTSVDPQSRKFYEKSLKDLPIKVFEDTVEDIPTGELAEAEVLCVFVFDRLNRELLEKLPRLRLIHTRSTGYDHIDLEYCRERGIRVTHVPAYSPSAIAQHTFALMLSLLRKLDRIREKVDRFDYSQSYDIVGLNLEDLTLGVVGTGRIGSYVAKYGIAFGMRVLAYDLYPKEELSREGVIYTDLEDLLRKSDVVSLHIPYTPETHHLIDSSRIELMKDGVILINTARGGVVDTNALYEHYMKGKFGGLGLDVFEGEDILILKKYRKGVSLPEVLKIVELSRYDNVIVNPHIAYLTQKAVKNIREQSVEVIRAFIEGNLEYLKEYSVV